MYDRALKVELMVLIFNMTGSSILFFVISMLVEPNRAATSNPVSIAFFKDLEERNALDFQSSRM
jgi:hypothetical protein